MTARPLPVALLLAACAGAEESPGVCADYVPEAWDPLLEDDPRVDEASAVWVTTGEGAIDAAATACAAPPCLGLAGPVSASTTFRVNRGIAHRLVGTLVSDVPVDLLVEQDTTQGTTRPLLRVTYPAGTTALAETFDLTVAGPDIRVAFTLATAGTATLDGFAVLGERWAATDAAPTGTVRLGVLVHLEDEPFFDVDAAAWERRARVIEGLSATLSGRGAALGIQADASFIRGAGVWDPAWVDARTAEGAGWSVHIHDESDAAAVEQATRDGRVALREAGVTTTDLNGGFLTGDWSGAAAAGFTSLTAFKDPETQLGLPRVQLQPWLPADGATAADPEAFLAHDPAGPLVYLPGHSLREADHARFPAAAANVMTQVLAHAHPDRVNTWYFVLHVDGFGAAADDPAALDAYLAEGLADDLAAYDTFLAALAPHVASGAVVFDTPGGMADAWYARYACPTR